MQGADGDAAGVPAVAPQAGGQATTRASLFIITRAARRKWCGSSASQTGRSGRFGSRAIIPTPMHRVASSAAAALVMQQAGEAGLAAGRQGTP